MRLSFPPPKERLYPDVGRSNVPLYVFPTIFTLRPKFAARFV